MTDAPARQIQGTPCWVSLMVHDLPQAQEFYGGLFGWEFQPGPRHFGPYVRAVVNGRPAAGIGEIPREWQLPIRWTTYLRCDDADATAERIRELHERLNGVEGLVDHLKVPASFAGQFYELRAHIVFVRQRLDAAANHKA